MLDLHHSSSVDAVADQIADTAETSRSPRSTAREVSVAYAVLRSSSTALHAISPAPARRLNSGPAGPIFSKAT